MSTKGEANMNKADLIERISRELGGRQEATTAIEVIVDAILREVSSGGSRSEERRVGKECLL